MSWNVINGRVTNMSQWRTRVTMPQPTLSLAAFAALGLMDVTAAGGCGTTPSLPFATGGAASSSSSSSTSSTMSSSSGRGGGGGSSSGSTDAGTDADAQDACVSGALSFDGAHSFVDIPNSVNSTAFDLGLSMTIEVWIKTMSPVNGDALFLSKYMCGTTAGWFLGMGPQPGTGMTVAEYFVSSQSRVSGTVSVNDNMWHHVAATWNSPTAIVYVDAIQTGMPMPIAPIPTTTSATVEIGAAGGGMCDFYEGLIDEVSVWSTVRSQMQIKQDMQGPTDPKAADLIAYWNFDNSHCGNIISDVSGHAENGVLSGSPLPQWVADHPPF